jgi:DNA-binding NtrC family response regulator
MPIKRNQNAPFWLALEKKEDEFMREMIEGALSVTGGNVSRAASALGIHRTYLAKLMKRLKIDRSSFAAPVSSHE